VSGGGESGPSEKSFMVEEAAEAWEESEGAENCNSRRHRRTTRESNQHP
jgi:hypothetical protein